MGGADEKGTRRCESSASSIEKSGGGAAGHGSASADGEQDSAEIAGETAIGCAGVHDVGPDSFIGEAMGADDLHMREFVADALDVLEGEDFHIEDDDVGA